MKLGRKLSVNTKVGATQPAAGLAVAACGAAVRPPRQSSPRWDGRAARCGETGTQLATVGNPLYLEGRMSNEEGDASFQPAPPARFVWLSNGDDWEGLFVDGKLFTEGHSITQEDILKAAQKFGTFTASEWQELGAEDIELIDERGCFPVELSELNGTYA